MRRAAVLLPLVVAVGIAGCGGSGGASTSGAQSASGATGGTQAVKIADFAFSPANLTVAKGTTVDFTNDDETSHTATAKGSGAFDTGTIKPGQSAEVTLDQTGTFAYYCAFHPFMKGTITVE
jgi:plastocyanin